MATEKTKPISCRISVENADKLSILLKKNGITLRELLENYVSGVNTFEVGVNTKTDIKSVNTLHENRKNLENNGVNTASESVNTDKFMELSEDLRMPYDVMYSEIKRLTDSGELMKEGMGFAVHEQGLDIKEFLEVCHEIGANPQKMINETISRMQKGK